MDELLYKEEVFKLVGFCMEIHRELGKGYDKVICKDALRLNCRMPKSLSHGRSRMR